MGAVKDKLLFQAYMKLHLLVYRETWRNTESEVNLGKFSVLRHGVHYLQDLRTFKVKKLLSHLIALDTYYVIMFIRALQYTMEWSNQGGLDDWSCGTCET